jgi:hypothetical protein
MPTRTHSMTRPSGLIFLETVRAFPFVPALPWLTRYSHVHQYNKSLPRPLYSRLRQHVCHIDGLSCTVRAAVASVKWYEHRYQLTSQYRARPVSAFWYQCPTVLYSRVGCCAIPRTVQYDTVTTDIVGRYSYLYADRLPKSTFQLPLGTSSHFWDTPSSRSPSQFSVRTSSQSHPPVMFRCHQPSNVVLCQQCRSYERS